MGGGTLVSLERSEGGIKKGVHSYRCTPLMGVVFNFLFGLKPSLRSPSLTFYTFVPNPSLTFQPLIEVQVKQKKVQPIKVTLLRFINLHFLGLLTYLKAKFKPSTLGLRLPL